MQIDLVLAGSGFAFGKLDRYPGGRQSIANVPVDRLIGGSGEELIILVVPAGGHERLVAVLVRRGVAVAKQVKLQLGRYHWTQAKRGGALNLAPEDGSGRHRDELTRFLVDDVGEDQRGLLLPGNDPQRRPIGLSQP